LDRAETEFDKARQGSNRVVRGPDRIRRGSDRVRRGSNRGVWAGFRQDYTCYFKVVGDAEGVTAFQMDIKVSHSLSWGETGCLP